MVPEFKLLIETFGKGIYKSCYPRTLQNTDNFDNETDENKFPQQIEKLRNKLHMTEPRIHNLLIRLRLKFCIAIEEPVFTSKQRQIMTIFTNFAERRNIDITLGINGTKESVFRSTFTIYQRRTVAIMTSTRIPRGENIEQSDICSGH